MQYYVHTAGQTIGPHDRAEILTALTAGDLGEDTYVQKTSGGDWRPVREVFPARASGVAAAPAEEPKPAPGEEAPPAEPAPAAGPPVAVDWSPAKYLRELRRRSCYSVLRFIIGFSFYTAVMAVALFLVGSMVMAFLEGSRGQKLYDFVLLPLAGLVAIFVLVAARQSAVLLIDMADTLLAHHARARRAEQTRDRVIS